MASELLEQLQKTETALNRLKKARGPGAGELCCSLLCLGLRALHSACSQRPVGGSHAHCHLPCEGEGLADRHLQPPQRLAMQLCCPLVVQLPSAGLQVAASPRACLLAGSCPGMQGEAASCACACRKHGLSQRGFWAVALRLSHCSLQMVCLSRCA